MVLDSSPGEAHTHSLEESAANNVGKSNNIKSKLKSKSNIQYVDPKSNNIKPKSINIYLKPHATYTLENF